MRWVVVYAKSLANDRKYRRPIRWKISSDDGGRAFANVANVTRLWIHPAASNTYLLHGVRPTSDELLYSKKGGERGGETEKCELERLNSYSLSLSLSIVKSNFYSYRYQAATSTVSKLPSIRARLVRITEILEGRRLPAFEDRRGGELGVIEYRSFENSALPGKFTWKHNL